MPSANLVRLVLLEARRGALPWLALTAVALSLGLAAFLSQVALTESRSLQAAIVAAVLRACAVFLIAYCAVASYTESGLGDASPYLLHLMIAAGLLAVPVSAKSELDRPLRISR